MISLLYLGNLSGKIEKDNILLKKQINFMQDQININEIEYSLFINYDYLKKLQKIYLNEKVSNSLDNRVSFYNLKEYNIDNLYTIGTR